MKLNKQARKMLYQTASTIKSENPEWSTHSCLEEAFIKCAGLCNYNMTLESMLPEYRRNPNATIQQLLKETE